MHQLESPRLKRPLTIVLVVVLVAFGLYTISHDRKVRVIGNQAVRLQASQSDPRMTDVVVTDSEGVVTRFLTLSDVYRDHYHPAEFKDGSLYILKRMGGSAGYETHHDWADELWRYTSPHQGTKLFSGRGLDFRVLADAGRIAVFQPEPKNAVVLIDVQGNVLKTLTSNDLGEVGADRMLTPELSDGDLLWVGVREGRLLVKLLVLNTQNFSIEPFDVSGLRITGSEFAIRPGRKHLAFSDYVAPLESESSQNERSATLYFYDLSNRTQMDILTISTDRPLAPAWLADGSIEYESPDGAGRIIAQVP